MPEKAASNDVTLQVRSVSKSLRGMKVLDSVSFSLAAGELVGLVGPNGAGKTTLIRIILGLLEADEGQVLINGLTVATAESRARVCYCLDNDGLYPTLTGAENLRFFQKAHGVEEDRISEVLESVGMVDAADVKVSSYSKGMRRRLGIARALLPSPDLLILDEPFAGLDPSGQRQLISLLQELRSHVGILFSSHDLHIVFSYASRVLGLKRTLLFDQLPADHWDGQRNLLERYEEVFGD